MILKGSWENWIRLVGFRSAHWEACPWGPASRKARCFKGLRLSLCGSLPALPPLCSVPQAAWPLLPQAPLLSGFGPGLANRKHCLGTGGWRKGEARVILTLPSMRGQHSALSVALKPTPVWPAPHQVPAWQPHTSGYMMMDFFLSWENEC